MIFFSASYFLHVHIQYVCNESAKYQIASKNTLRWVDFTVHAPYNHAKATFEKQREITLKELTHRLLFYSNSNISSI